MATKLKQVAASTAGKVANSTRSSPTRDPESIAGEKYLLKITAGPSLEESQQQPVVVNGRVSTTVSNEFMTTDVKVRIRNYRGVPLSSPPSSIYFNHPSRSDTQYSIGFTFTPHKDLNAKDVVWGVHNADPVRDRLPPGFNFAVRIVKDLVDPGIELDAYADEPWLYAPALGTLHAFRIGGRQDDSEDSGSSSGSSQDAVHDDSPLQEGADGTGRDVRDQHNMPPDAGKRRKLFLSAEKREQFVFEKGREYHADFYNPYIDFSTFSVKLPGFSVGVLKYIKDKTHKLRWVLKNRTTGEVYFSVIFTLLFGEALQQELVEETRKWEAAKAKAASRNRLDAEKAEIVVEKAYVDTTVD